jgi:hypothetical protein
MKQTPNNYRARAALAGLMLAASVGVSRANIIVNQFNTAAEATAYVHDYASAGTTAFASQDALDEPTSGSMQFSGSYGPSDQGPAFQYHLGTAIPAAGITGIEFDLKIDPNSPLDPGGNAFYFQIGVRNPGLTFLFAGNVAPSHSNSGWMHFKANVSALSGDIQGIEINGYDANYTSPQTVVAYIDNIVFDSGAATYPNYRAFSFDNPTSIAGCLTNWYGGPVSFSWSTNDAGGNTNSGSLYIVADLSTVNDNGNVAELAFDTNWIPYSTDTNFIDGSHYTNVECDVMWDSSNSTIDLTNFNRFGDVTGLPIGLMTNPGGAAQEAFGSAAGAVPNAASNGWVHMSFALNPATPGIIQTIGLFFKKYNNASAPGGIANYWIDNVTFNGGVAAAFRPTMAISKPTVGMQCVSQGTGANPPYDREGLVTFDTIYSFADQSSPVSYGVNIASMPKPAFPNYSARIMLVPANVSEPEADYFEPTIAIFDIQNRADGTTSATMEVKTNTPNGNGALYSAGNPTFSATNGTGNWTFTFTNNTGIRVTAPDGTSTNWSFALDLTSAQVSSFFGGGTMVAYVGSFANGGANEGQRAVIGSFGITNGTTLLYDNFVQDSNLDINVSGIPGAGAWLLASDASAPYLGWGVYLVHTNTPYFIDWNTPSAGFGLQTNSTLSGGVWSTNTGLTNILLASHYHTEVDVTNLPASGPLFWRLAEPGY